MKSSSARLGPAERAFSDRVRMLVAVRGIRPRKQAVQPATSSSSFSGSFYRMVSSDFALVHYPANIVALVVVRRA